MNTTSFLRAKQSRSSGDSAVGPARQVQFLIERECPEEDDYRTNLEEYPAVVFVEWPPIPREFAKLDNPCSSPRFYLLVNEDARRLGAELVSGKCVTGWAVCEHMGRVIE